MKNISHEAARYLAEAIVYSVDKASRSKSAVLPHTNLETDLGLVGVLRKDMFDSLQDDTGVYIHDYTLATPMKIFRYLRSHQK